MAIQKLKVVCYCMSGTNVYDAVVQAISLCAEQRVDVEFEHNDTIYTAKFREMCEHVMETARSGKVE
jgi:hypothetical protein